MSQNHELCIKNEELCVKHEELCVKNEEFCIKNDELCITNDEFRRLLMASCACDSILSSIIDYLMAQEDNTGVNEHLVMVMLDERRDHPLAHTIALKVRQQQEARVLSSVVAALGHVRGLRNDDSPLKT